MAMPEVAEARHLRWCAQQQVLRLDVAMDPAFPVHIHKAGAPGVGDNGVEKDSVAL